MAEKMVFNRETGKMEKIGKNKGEVATVKLSAELAEKLEQFAIEDGYNFSGISYVTIKDATGKTKKDKDGKPVFKNDKDGKPEKIAVERSTAKVNSAISDYVNIGVQLLIEMRKSKNKE